MRTEATGLKVRVGLVLGALVVAGLVVAAAWWMQETRRAIGEEVEAASRVAEQWLVVVVAETLRDEAHGPDRLMAHLKAVGRLRANQLEVIGADGVPLYRSPEPSYKAGRFAPAWFDAWVAPALQVRRFDAGDREIVLRPDASRAVLDAWDDMKAGFGFVLALLFAVTSAARYALNRALAPLAEIDAALARGADGRFDIRLPSYRVAELDRVAASYNRLADTLDHTRAQNFRLAEEQAFARALQVRLEEERRVIARELHDELGQGITAVRAISGAILQRCDDQPQIHGSAQAILAMTSQMQDGVRAILQRLRPAAVDAAAQLDLAIGNYCRMWSGHHPDIALSWTTAPLTTPVGEALAVAVLRLLQESLTNVARHSGASRVEVSFGSADGRLELQVADDGCGLPAAPRANRFGLAGMRERVDEFAGELLFETPPGGGLRVRARLPNPPAPLSPSFEESAHGIDSH